ncbi:LacI family DNA-binding transcriptional regulator [Marinilabiliaceae bacterium ANBcel2]|nr:LacI family DNA-binding transcriptional regulator [Marinilabiliaceae bacterium ANBcel2]
MSKSTITINDIARELNVAPSTVSRALNNSPRISEATKERIREKAMEIGYDLNMVASSLSRQRTNIIGVIIPFINNHFFSLVVSGIEDLAVKSGFRIIIAQTYDSVVKEEEALKMFSSARVDGIIACLSVETRDISHFKRIKKVGIPIVLFDRVSFDIDCPKVLVDNYDGAFQAVSHLIKGGCERIAYLGGPSNCRIFDERAKGYKDAVKKNGLQLLPGYSFSTDLSERDVHEAMKLWLGKYKAPDAIFTSTGNQGLMVTKLAIDAGFKIPDDLSIISFGDSPSHEYIVPSLSAIEMPGYDIGRSSMEFIENEIDGKKGDSRTIIKPILLVIRSSSFR